MSLSEEFIVLYHGYRTMYYRMYIRHSFALNSCKDSNSEDVQHSVDATPIMVTITQHHVICFGPFSIF